MIINVFKKETALFFGCIFLLLFTAQNSIAQKLSVYDLSVNHLVNPIGLDDPSPRLSWKLSSTERDVQQTAYEVRVGSDPKISKALWQSGKVNTAQSVYIDYDGPKPESAKRYYWQVRVWDNHGNASKWSEAAYWETGLLAEQDWQAKWIQHLHPSDSGEGPVPMFRKSFIAKGKVRQARLYVTSYGLYEAYLNGERVGDQYFTPGWTSYHKNLQYQVYDVTPMLASGNNALGILLGDGWYKGNLPGGRNYYGEEPALLAQLMVQYQDGSTEIIASDDSWKSFADGAIRMADLYNGETYDARKEIADWSRPNFDDGAWESIRINADLGYANLAPSPAPPVTLQERLKAVEVLTTPKGEKVIDFGQNLVGWVQFQVKGNAGDSVRIEHAEVLDKDGNFYTENLRAADATITYILKGGVEETYHPHFSFQGFRFIKLSGAVDGLDLNNIEAQVLHSNMALAGNFETSDSLLNQLQHNIQWGQKGNFLDVPTDCPQRDERLGWTGDAQAFFSTAAYNMDVAGFFTKWLKDLRLDQFESGAVPHVIPHFWDGEPGGSAGWADAATIIPWDYYQIYGDANVLETQYESMKKWVQFMGDHSTDDLWDDGWHFGDWLFYIPDDDRDGRAAITDKYLIAQAFYAHSVQLMINTAQVLGNERDEQYYSDLLGRIKKAFQREFVTPSGRLVSSSQTAYVLALHFDLLPEELRSQAADRLVANIESYDNHITTGFLGTPYICHVLSRFGHWDAAYKLLKQDTYPSWLYPVKMGATTIWERWDGIKPDGSFQNKDMNSFNHYAYGAIGDWMYKNIGGIQLADDGIGYSKIKVAPTPGAGLTHARATFESVYGPITSFWEIKEGKMEMNITIPPNTEATVVFPAGVEGSITENGKDVPTTQNGTAKETKVGSGTYQFVFNYS